MLVLAAVGLVGAVGTSAQGAGILIPSDPSLPPLAIKYLRVDTVIDNQAATTHVVQEFLNTTDRALECTYIFPLPKGAAIREFAMYIDGKRMTGELLEKDKARTVYEEIVRRAKDPGLLEYIDHSLLRLRIFPVPAKGTQKVEIRYTELIPADQGLAEYVFPLKAGEKASRTLEDFTVAVTIKSSAAIKSVYSPTHEVGVSRPSDHEAVAGMESKSAMLDRDFHLFYTLSEKDFGLSLMTYRPDPDKPGMFLMLISPKTEADESRRVPRDVLFVLDTSGSMKGEKLAQVKKALAFCVDKLEAKDRFAIVQFATTAETFANGWTEASRENVRKAAEWAEKFEAAGGTNISEALEKVYALPVDDGRLETVLFLTDGRPTVGTTEQEPLLRLVKENNKRSLRMFTFGVGDDVNTHLLDRMANDTGGLPEYVRESEAIDGKVTRLFSKMSFPVLTDLALEVTNVKVTEMFPRQLPDLFRGAQVVVLGSYEGSGDAAIRLKGRTGKKNEEVVYEGTFAKKSDDRTFIGPLFANRKIGFLLDQIRLHGEEKELKDEVVRLSLAYGIETPYTSYLVLENDQQYKQYGINRQKAEVEAKPSTLGKSTAVSAPAATPAEKLSLANNAGDKAIDGLTRAYRDDTKAAKVGGGTLILSDTGGVSGGNSYSYTGGTTISNGTLKARSEETGTVNVAGGATGSGSITINSGAVSYGGANTAPAMPAPPETASGEKNKRSDYSVAAQPAGKSESRVQEPGSVNGLRASEDTFKQQDSGKDAVDIATEVRRMRESSTAAESKGIRTVQEKGGHKFFSFRGIWVDQAYLGTEKLTKIKWGSEAYFQLVREKADLKDAFTLGERVVVVTAKGQAVAVMTEEGEEKLSDDAFKALFIDVPEPKAKN
jgi:Ca-activated chloride channel family protein